MLAKARCAATHPESRCAWHKSKIDRFIEIGRSLKLHPYGASVTSTERAEPFGFPGELEEGVAVLFQTTEDRPTDAAEPGCC